MPSRITVLISGRGSNLAALIDAARADELGCGVIVRVISNRPGAAGLARAAEAGIATTVVDHRQFPSREAFDAALREAIDADRPDLVVLAGFMRVLGAAFVRHYEGRMLNIHPSLLPAFPGLDTHRRALDAGATTHGCSVHFVSADVDGGPVVAQAAVPVLAGDDADRLAKRVLEQEHRLLPEVVRWFCAGRLALAGGAARLDGVPLAAPIVLAEATAAEPSASVAATPGGGPSRRRVRGVFWLAPVPPVTTEPVLTATIESMPPPPTARAAPKAIAPAPPARSQAVPREPPHAQPEPPHPTRAPTRTNASNPKVADARQLLASQSSRSERAVASVPPNGGDADASTASAVDHDVTSRSATPSPGGAVSLPPRVDLAYRVFLGTRGFMIGDATYRFEHDGNRYRISTVGEARGLAAL